MRLPQNLEFIGLEYESSAESRDSPGIAVQTATHFEKTSGALFWVDGAHY